VSCQCRTAFETGLLGNRPDRAVGWWTAEEEALLVKHIKEANTALGMDPLSSEAPWDIVRAKMGNVRSTTQCRKKW
jgi:hypothetical protein